MSGKWFKVIPYGLAPGNRTHRLRRGRAARARAQAQADPGGGVGLFAGHRLEALPRDRGRRRRAAHGGHGALRRARGGGRLPVARGHRGLGDEHDAQDAAWPARRLHPDALREREGDELRGVSRAAGRPADARDRRQGRGVRRGAAARLPPLPGARARERARARARAAGSRAAHRLRRHRQPPVPGRPARQADHRQGRRGRARPRGHHRQQERDSQRPREAVRDVRHPPGQPGDHDARILRDRDGGARAPHRGRAGRAGRRAACWRRCAPAWPRSRAAFPCTTCNAAGNGAERVPP